MNKYILVLLLILSFSPVAAAELLVENKKTLTVNFHGIYSNRIYFEYNNSHFYLPISKVIKFISPITEDEKEIIVSVTTKSNTTYTGRLLILAEEKVLLCQNQVLTKISRNNLLSFSCNNTIAPKKYKLFAELKPSISENDMVYINEILCDDDFYDKLWNYFNFRDDSFASNYYWTLFDSYSKSEFFHQIDRYGDVKTEKIKNERANFVKRLSFLFSQFL